MIRTPEIHLLITCVSFGGNFSLAPLSVVISFNLCLFGLFGLF